MDQYKYLDMQYMNLAMEMVDTKTHLADARRELAYTRMELANKKMQNAGQGAPTSIIIITLPLQTIFVNPTKANCSAKLPDTPKYTGERDNLEPWIMQLKIKLERNIDYYLIIKSKLFYAVSRLKERAVILV